MWSHNVFDLIYEALPVLLLYQATQDMLKCCNALSIWAYHLRMLMHSLPLSAVLGYKCRWHFCTTIYLSLLLFTILSSQLWCCPVSFFTWQFLLAATIVHLWWDCKKRGFSHPFPDLCTCFCIVLCFSFTWSLGSIRNMLEYLSSLVPSGLSTHFVMHVWLE